MAAKVNNMNDKEQWVPKTAKHGQGQDAQQQQQTEGPSGVIHQQQRDGQGHSPVQILKHLLRV